MDWQGRGQSSDPTPPPPPPSAQGRGQPCRAEPLQCQSSCAPMQLLSCPRLSCPPSLPSCRPFAKDKRRVGGMLRPSPPSGAACLCQDVSLHIVMKGVIKVTACWNGARSSSPLYPSLSCLCETPDVFTQQQPASEAHNLLLKRGDFVINHSYSLAHVCHSTKPKMLITLFASPHWLFF